MMRILAARHIDVQIHAQLIGEGSEESMGQVGVEIDVPRGENPHHIIEACFKAFARAMDFATQVDPRLQGVLSTKGSL